MDIFNDDSDYRFFLHRLKENLFPEQRTAPLQEGRPLTGHRYIRKTLPGGSFSLISYCLMPNHFHFLIRQNSSLPVSKLFAKVCTGYSMYFNRKYDRVGALVQSKFKAVLVDSDAYLTWLSAYIHNNPKTAGLIEKLENWQWSSYLDYMSFRQGKLCEKDVVLSQFKNFFEYGKFVEESLEKIQKKKSLEHLLLD